MGRVGSQQARECALAGVPSCWRFSEELCGTHLKDEEKEGIYPMWWAK